MLSDGQNTILAVDNSLDMTINTMEASFDLVGLDGVALPLFACAQYSLAPPAVELMACGNLALWLPSQTRKARPICFRLLRQAIFWLLPRADARAGRSMAPRIATIASTTNNSRSVNAFSDGFIILDGKK